MYELTTSWKGTYVTRPSLDGSTISMSLGEITVLIDRLLCRKERNNGVGRDIKSKLRFGIEVSYRLKGGSWGFRVSRSLIFPDRMNLTLWGNAEALLMRINDSQRKRSAPKQDVPYQERQATDSRKLIRNKQARALPGGNAKLHWHFRNHTLLYDDVVRMIAQSAKKSADSVRRKLINTLDDRGVGSFRLSRNFVYRVDFACVRSKHFDLLAPVELRTTDDNKQLAWRRLRSLLKSHFGCVSKVRQSTQTAYLARKREERLYRRYG